jgi:hypothetical protein
MEQAVAKASGPLEEGERELGEVSTEDKRCDGRKDLRHISWRWRRE